MKKVVKYWDECTEKWAPGWMYAIIQEDDDSFVEAADVTYQELSPEEYVIRSGSIYLREVEENDK